MSRITAKQTPDVYRSAPTWEPKISKTLQRAGAAGLAVLAFAWLVSDPPAQTYERPCEELNARIAAIILETNAAMLEKQPGFQPLSAWSTMKCDGAGQFRAP